ncbi:MAG: serine--tRNA ligase, partial [Clostridiales bacterium]|nr:serine--tRNA ligase [Clostridiales bacterium]
MLDIKLIRSNPEKIKAGAKKRCIDVDALVDDSLKIDEARREETGKVEKMTAE